jgi:hypothetical protein
LLIDGNILIGFIPILVSPIAMLYFRVTMEDGHPKGLFNPTTQSYAFLLGDALLLPMAFAFMALGWKRLAHEQGFHVQAWWLIFALVAGAAIMMVWRRMEMQAYTKLGAADRLDSPTKLWHDYVVYGSLGTLLVFGGVPVVVKDFTGNGWLVLLCFAGWVALGVLDGSRKLNPANLHPRKEETYLA